MYNRLLKYFLTITLSVISVVIRLKNKWNKVFSSLCYWIFRILLEDLGSDAAVDDIH